MKLYCHVVIATEKQHKDQVIVIGLGYDVMHSMCLTWGSSYNKIFKIVFALAVYNWGGGFNNCRPPSYQRL